MFTKEENIIQKIKKGERVDFTPLYRYFSLVENYILKNSGSKDDAKDIYQNTLVAFYKNAGKSDFELTVQLKTYLFSIAKNLWLKEIRNRSKIKTKDTENFDQIDDTVGDFEQKEVLLTKMHFSLELLSENCRQLIRLFHFQAKNWAEIMALMGYKNEHAARNQKYKCLQKLKSLMDK